MADNPLSLLIGLELDKNNEIEKQCQAELEKLSKNLNLKITNLDITDIEESISKIQEQLNDSSKNLKLKISDVQFDGDNSKVNEILNKLKEFNKENKINIDNSELEKEKVLLEEIAIKFNKIKNNAASQERYLNNLENKLERIRNISERQHRTNENYDNAKELQNIENLQQRINALREKESIISRSEKNELDQIVATMQERVKNEGSYASEINRTTKFLQQQLQTLEELNVKIKNSGSGTVGNREEKAQISEELQKQIAEINQLIKQNQILGNVEKERISSSTKELRNETNELTAFRNSFGNILKQTAEYMTGGSLIFATLNQAREGFKDIVSVDNSMRDLRKVTNETSAEYAEFKNRANETAVALGNQTENVVEATAAFAQMGYTYKEAQELAKNSIIYQNVGDMSQEDASKGLISTMKAFDMDANQSIQIMDKANEVANRYAINVKGINDALMRGGSAMHVANNNLSESIALITAANSAIQDQI